MLAAGVISFPVRAFVISVVKERMESIPREEVLELNDMVQSKPTEADTFSREYSVDEEERSRELWQAYEDGKFPENVITQVDNADDAPEGTVCYVRSTGVFHLPAQEMTDEEILEIIDFQHKMSYAVSQGQAAQEARAQVEAEEKRFRDNDYPCFVLNNCLYVPQVFSAIFFHATTFPPDSPSSFSVSALHNIICFPPVSLVCPVRLQFLPAFAHNNTV